MMIIETHIFSGTQQISLPLQTTKVHYSVHFKMYLKSIVSIGCSLYPDKLRNINFNITLSFTPRSPPLDHMHKIL
jgi:hypothetical protein